MSQNFYCNYHDREEEGNYNIVTMYDGETIGICDDAYENEIIYCENCDYPYFREDDRDDHRYLCPDCYSEQHNSSYIGDYHDSHYRALNFHGNPKNNVYFGLEIEVESEDCSSEDKNEAAKAIKTDSSIGDYFSLERDGSLDEGFECVSEPMSYEFIMNNKIIDKLCEKLKSNYMCAYDTCGVHIHVSLTDEVAEKIVNILYFLENNKKDTIKFSGRKEANFIRWSNFYSLDKKVSRLQVCSYIISDYERYRCLNLNNDNTIEFRLFGGSIDEATIKGYLEFTSLLTEFDFNAKDFKDLLDIAEKNSYNYLSDLIKTRVFA